MARIPRLYRVVATYADATEKLRHYQTPEAADERRVRFEAGKPKPVAVEVTPSHPITYPRPAGDPTPLDIPDSLVPAAVVAEFIARCGLKPEAVSLAMFSPAEVVLEYQPDPTGKRAPKLWRVGIIPE